MHKNHSSLKWIVWTLAAIFYFYEYLLRISPTVMVTELMVTFSITASVVGLIGAFFLYSYAPMQIFVGILLDRYGLKLLLSISCLICGIGALLFGAANLTWFLKIGRFCIGFGAAFAFVSMAFVCTHYFSKKRGALLLGLANSIGMAGAMGGTTPLRLLNEAIGWRLSMIGFGILGFILALLLYLFIKDIYNSSTKEKTTFPHLVKDLKTLMKNPYTWVNGLVALLFYATTTVFGGLWGVPFLKSAFNLTTLQASSCISMIFLGWLIGGPIIGYLSDHLEKRKPIITFCILSTFICILFLLYSPQLSLFSIHLLIFLVGFFSSGELLNFTLAVEINPKKVKASALGLTNLLIAFGDSVFLPIAGFLLDYHWDGKIDGGIRVYSVEDYRTALTILPLCLFLAFIFSLVLKEKRHNESSLQKPFN